MQKIGFFIAKLTVRSTCFGHHYAHHQELKSYTDGCCLWYLALWFIGRWSGVELWVMCPVGCPKHVERTVSFAIKKPIVASSWPFNFHELVLL